MKARKVKLQDFCDVEKLYAILENWSKCTGLSAAVVDEEGVITSETFNESPICGLIKQSAEGLMYCSANWKDKTVGIYECHAGMYDFAIPLQLPDGTKLGRVLAGQALTNERCVDYVKNKIEHFDLPESEVDAALEATTIKSQSELDSSYELLRQMIEFFVEKSYANWINKITYTIDVRMFMTAAFSVYGMSVHFNLTRNEYHVVNFETYIQSRITQTGKIDEIVKKAAQTIPDEIQKSTFEAMFSRKAVMEAFKQGKNEFSYQHKEKGIDGVVHWVETRILRIETDDNELHAIVLGRIIDEEIEKNQSLADALASAETVQKKLVENNNIIASAGIGVWKIFLYENEKPKLICSKKMIELMGFEDYVATAEENYEAWYGRIKRSSVASVDRHVKEMMEGGKVENTYTWMHPTLGERYVRCGGTSQYIPGKGYILSGYHSDVTDIVNADIKQKERIANALEETKKQKTLLQQALSDYKQADYDRRTDFLTGLRNRQDMFDLLHDALSGSREKIQAMFMMDIDNFKMLNDTYGHAKGDECLKAIGQALIHYGLENSMYFYRYGGEEMLGVSFEGCKPASAIAEELVQMIYDLNIECEVLKTGRVTISLGYTDDNSRYEKMIDRADTAMYKAKAAGKNRAVCFEKMKEIK